GGACTVSVQFAPTTTGPQTATVASVSGPGGAGLASVPLSGTGWDFDLTLQNGAPPVALNKSGNYDVAVSPRGGFTGTVGISVACNIPGVSSCSVTPSSLNMNGSSGGIVHVQVNSSLIAHQGIYVGIFVVIVLSAFIRSELMIGAL